MLKQWKQTCGNSATYECLARALQHRTVGRSDLAAKYCEICRDTSVGKICAFDKKKDLFQTNGKACVKSTGYLIQTIFHQTNWPPLFKNK